MTTISSLVQAAQQAGIAYACGNQSQYQQASQIQNAYAQQLAAQHHSSMNQAAAQGYGVYGNSSQGLGGAGGLGQMNVWYEPEVSTEKSVLLLYINSIFKERPQVLLDGIRKIVLDLSKEASQFLMFNGFTANSVEYYQTLSDQDLLNYLKIIA